LRGLVVNSCDPIGNSGLSRYFQPDELATMADKDLVGRARTITNSHMVALPVGAWSWNRGTTDHTREASAMQWCLQYLQCGIVWFMYIRSLRLPAKDGIPEVAINQPSYVPHKYRPSCECDSYEPGALAGINNVPPAILPLLISVTERIRYHVPYSHRIPD
jgi:hypothetical protein